MWLPLQFRAHGDTQVFAGAFGFDVAPFIINACRDLVSCPRSGEVCQLEFVGGELRRMRRCPAVSFRKRFCQSGAGLRGVLAPREYGGIVYVTYDCRAVVSSAIVNQTCIVKDTQDRGERGEPCGMPVSTVYSSDSRPSSMMLVRRSLRKLAIHYTSLSSTLLDRKLCSSCS